MVYTDRNVAQSSTALSGTDVLVGICGGIAAVDSVRLLRELRRHGAEPTVIMTYSAQKVISPLAVEWAAGVQPLTQWGAEMSQLDSFDAVLVAPATRRCIAAHVHGILDSPLQMALSAARARHDPILFVPSMHSDLFDDPVTDDLCQTIEGQGATVLWGDLEENKRKTPDAVQIVADLCHVVNARRPLRKKVALTLGRNRSRVDAVRWLSNTSSGNTGWVIADHLYRMGHDVHVIAGETTARPTIELPALTRATDPDDMLECLVALAGSAQPPDAWVHAAAVLDYVVADPLHEKVPSGDDHWQVGLVRSTKHLQELTPLSGDSCRIAFKLESGVSDNQLIESARNLLERHSLEGVVANLHDEVYDDSDRRAIWVSADGSTRQISSLSEMAEMIEATICG